MILIIEILLTIRAWQKGWKGWALLPLGVGILMGFFVGIAAGAGGGTIEDILPLCVLIELGIIVSLIAMSVKAPKYIETERESEDVEVVDLTTGVAV